MHGPSTPTVIELVDRVRPHEAPAALVERASELAGGPVALYAVDIGGRVLRHVAGEAELPDEIEIPRTLGPELADSQAEATLQQLRADGIHASPLWTRGRANTVFLTAAEPQNDLSGLAAEAAAVLDMNDRLTDVLERVRRRSTTSPAAELQQSLLPPRVVTVAGAEIAGAVVPAYQVGGDWFDHADDAGGTWLAVADGAGRGAKGMALGAMAIGGVRAQRRSGGALIDAAYAVDEAIREMGDPGGFVTAVLAHFDPVERALSWLACGHAHPLLFEPDGTAVPLTGPSCAPLGTLELGPPPQLARRVLEPDQRVVLYTDGVTDRRTTGGGFVAVEGIIGAVRRARSLEAVAAAIELVSLVLDAADEDPDDDATLVVLRVLG